MKILKSDTKQAKRIIAQIESNDKTLYGAYIQPSYDKKTAYNAIYSEYINKVYGDYASLINHLESKFTICTYNTFQFTCGYKIVFQSGNIEYIYYTKNEKYKINITK